MSKQTYTHVRELLPEIKAMVEEEKHCGKLLNTSGSKTRCSKKLLARERAKQRKLEAGITPRSKGKQRKCGALRDIVAEQAYEIRRLRMGNELLRDFLQSTGRKSESRQSMP